MRRFEYYNPQHLIFGRDSFEQLATLPMPGKKACVVCTEERLFIDRAQALLKKNGVDSVVYDKVRPNPDTASINSGAQFALENGCDFIVAVGGGSSIDSSKCIAMLMGNDAKDDIWDYVPYLEGHKKPEKSAPYIAVCTTAGPGSGATQSGVVCNDALNVKLDVCHPCMFAAYTIVDPKLQVSVPKDLTAMQGMDIIFHCMEGYLDQFHTPYTDMLYLTALKYAAGSLRACFREPDDLEARGALALADNMSGMGEAMVDVMSLHAMAHTLGSFHHDIPHGAALSLLAPEAFAFYCGYPVQTTQRMAYMSELLGYGFSAEGCVRFISDILKDLDLYKIDYEQYGVDPGRAAEYAHHTVNEISCYMDKDEHSPTAEEVEAMFNKAFERQKRLREMK